MAKFVKKVGIYSIYELDENECRQYFRVYPTFVCWDSKNNEDFGDMDITENETETIEQMTEWCNKNS